MSFLSQEWLPLFRKSRMLPKLCGGDYEFANFITGIESSDQTARRASLALLAEIEGLPSSRAASHAPAASEFHAPLDGVETAPIADSSWQDYGRKFLVNGGCFYIDMEHLEGCLPEVLSAFDHLAATHAMYRLAHRACEAANAKLPPGERLHVLATNSDGQGHSFGSHLNFLLSRIAWEDLFYRKLHHQGFLAAYQASSIIIAGLGKVGSENGRPQADFQISQRADFFEMLAAVQTTFRRPLLNTRCEPLCGVRRWGEEADAATRHLARLHVIFYDHNLCHAASYLKVGVLQLILAMMESGHVNPGLLLEDPLDAVARWSHDPTLQTRSRLLAGTEVTAVELQLRFLDEVRRFVGSGRCKAVVPDADMIVELWADTLGHLEARRWGPLSRRLDWVLKLSLLHQTIEQQPHLTWNSPEIKHLDHLYSSLDPQQGLYWACERSGLVERLVPESRIERFVIDPPTDTRAWTRGSLLKMADPAWVDRIDWDQLSFQRSDRPVCVTLDLPDPLGFTKASTALRLPDSGDMWDALTALGASQSASPEQGQRSSNTAFGPPALDAADQIHKRD